MVLDTDKAYLIGLIIGGGILKNDSLQIVLPYKNWGDIKLNPERGGTIAEDIIKRTAPTWKSIYNIDISYKVDGSWKIICDEVTDELKNDLQRLGLPLEGEYRYTAKLDALREELVSDLHKKNFITGLVDTVGSLAKSHRRFVEDFQIISFELKGANFSLVSSIVEILMDLGCTPDQILWNHPNQHSGNDRYYSNWKKGFKVRVSLNDYMLKGGFIFEAKKLSADSNKKLQANEEATSIGKKSKVSGRDCLHKDEYSEWLPQSVRGGHFIHYLHLAHHLGVSVSDDFNINVYLQNFEKYFCPFTCLTKGTNEEISEIIDSESYLEKTNYREVVPAYGKLHEIHMEGNSKLVFGNSNLDGFPINFLLRGLSYVLCADHDERMFGKRVRNGYMHWIQEEVKEKSRDDTKILIPDVGTCLMVQSSSHAALIGYVNDLYNKTLINKIEGSKVYLDEPKYDNCVKLIEYE